MLPEFSLENNVGKACNMFTLSIIRGLAEETCEKLEIWIENIDKRLLEISQLHPRARNKEVPASFCEFWF